MRTIRITPKSLRLAAISLFSVSTLLFTACEDTAIETHNDPDEELVRPPEALEQVSEATPVERAEANIAGKLSPATGEENARTNGSTTYINFQDEQACTWNPDICTNTFVMWPGYIQKTGYNEWGYAWMSNGPGTSFISYGTGDHYHIMGLAMPEVEANPAHTAMFGSDWFAFYMQRSGFGRINFDLTQIKVNGDVPITLWFKAANGSWWYWPRINPGRWNLPGATNIQEFHVRAVSAAPGDNYSIDDIRVRGL